MKKATTLKISLIAGLLACSTLSALIPNISYATDFTEKNKQITYTTALPAISVTGFAERTVSPDTASITLGVVSEAANTADAKLANDQVQKGLAQLSYPMLKVGD